MMEISIEHTREVTVVRPNGRLDAARADEFRDVVTRLFDEGRRWIVIDFAQTEHVAGAAIRILLMLRTKLGNADGALVLCGMNDSVRPVFGLAAGAGRFAMTESTDDAIRKLNSRQGVVKLSKRVAELLAAGEAYDEKRGRE